MLTHRHDYVGLQAPAPPLIRLTASLTKLCMCKCTQPFKVPFILVRLLSTFSGNPREISWICRPTAIAHGHTLCCCSFRTSQSALGPPHPSDPQCTCLGAAVCYVRPLWPFGAPSYWTLLSPTHPVHQGVCCLSSSILCCHGPHIPCSERYPWRAQCQGLHGRQRYLWCRWAVALGSTTSFHIARQKLLSSCAFHSLAKKRAGSHGFINRLRGPTFGVSSPFPRQTSPAHCQIRKALKSTQGGNVHVPFAYVKSLCETMLLPVPLSFLRINNQAYLVPRLVAKAILNTYEAGRALASAHPGITHNTHQIARLGLSWDRCRVPVALCWTRLTAALKVQRSSAAWTLRTSLEYCSSDVAPPPLWTRHSVGTTCTC